MSAYIFWTQRGQARPYADYYYAGTIQVPKDRPREAVIGELTEAAGKPLAVHEFPYLGISENSLASRLSELSASRRVIGTTRHTGCRRITN